MYILPMSVVDVNSGKLNWAPYWRNYIEYFNDNPAQKPRVAIHLRENYRGSWDYVNMVTGAIMFETQEDMTRFILTWS